MLCILLARFLSENSTVNLLRLKNNARQLIEKKKMFHFDFFSWPSISFSFSEDKPPGAKRKQIMG